MTAVSDEHRSQAQVGCEILQASVDLDCDAHFQRCLDRALEVEGVLGPVPDQTARPSGIPRLGIVLAAAATAAGILEPLER